MVAQKKTTMFKRSRHSLAVTPLTRQVMTKSIHRAILEYQNSQHGIAVSPKSPLDLRVRGRDISKVENDSLKTTKCDERSSKSCISTSLIIKSDSLESNSILSPLETVYEQDRDANAESSECYERECCFSSNYEIVEYSNHDQSVVNEPSIPVSIQETPVLVSRKLSGEIISDDNNVDPEIWYTPKEYLQTEVIENMDVRQIFVSNNFHDIILIQQNNFFRRFIRQR